MPAATALMPAASDPALAAQPAPTKIGVEPECKGPNKVAVIIAAVVAVLAIVAVIVGVVVVGGQKQPESQNGTPAATNIVNANTPLTQSGQDTTDVQASSDMLNIKTDWLQFDISIPNGSYEVSEDGNTVNIFQNGSPIAIIFSGKSVDSRVEADHADYILGRTTLSDGEYYVQMWLYYKAKDGGYSPLASYDIVGLFIEDAGYDATTFSDPITYRNADGEWVSAYCQLTRDKSNGMYSVVPRHDDSSSAGAASTTSSEVVDQATEQQAMHDDFLSRYNSLVSACENDARMSGNTYDMVDCWNAYTAEQQALAAEVESYIASLGDSSLDAAVSQAQSDYEAAAYAAQNNEVSSHPTVTVGGTYNAYLDYVATIIGLLD